MIGTPVPREPTSAHLLSPGIIVDVLWSSDQVTSHTTVSSLTQSIPSLPSPPRIYAAYGFLEEGGVHWGPSHKAFPPSLPSHDCTAWYVISLHTHRVLQ